MDVMKVDPQAFQKSSTRHFLRFQKINSISIFAGFFGMKNDALLFGERVTLFTKLIKYYINTGNKFSFGIDELMLKLLVNLKKKKINTYRNH